MALETVTELVEFPVNGGTCPGYLARPAEGTHPGVVVIQEWWGLEEHIKDVARRFAREGFVALAPDLYHGKVTSEPDEARKLAMELNRQRALLEVRRAVAYLKAHPGVAPKKVGVIGFCMGGGLALLTAIYEPELDAAVVFYGRNPDPIDLVAQIRCPLLGIYGEADQGIPPSEVERLGEALKRYGKQFELHIYPGAPHAFFNDTRPQIYRPEAAADAWAKTLAFFRRHLVGEPAAV
ncbi:MAG: carboxymethylenebutenolidase [Chloroflexota bacterium]